MFALTQAQNDAINSTPNTHDYSKESMASHSATGDDLMNDLQLRFESDIEGMYDGGDDIGGICIYMKTDGTLVAYYDYENFRGTVFNN